MAHYIGDCVGGFCKVAVEIDIFIEKIAEDGYLKEVYEETLFSYQLQSSFDDLVKFGMLIREGDPDEFSMDEIEASVEKLKMSVIELLGADAAIEAEEEVERMWLRMREENESST